MWSWGTKRSDFTHLFLTESKCSRHVLTWSGGVTLAPWTTLLTMCLEEEQLRCSWCLIGSADQVFGGRHCHHPRRGSLCSMPLRKIIASMDEQSLVRIFQVLMGTKSQTKRPSIIKREVQKVVLLFEATEREWTKYCRIIDHYSSFST